MLMLSVVFVFLVLTLTGMPLFSTSLRATSQSQVSPVIPTNPDTG